MCATVDDPSKRRCTICNLSNTGSLLRARTLRRHQSGPWSESEPETQDPRRATVTWRLQRLPTANNESAHAEMNRTAALLISSNLRSLSPESISQVALSRARRFFLSYFYWRGHRQLLANVFLYLLGVSCDAKAAYQDW